MTEDRQDLLAPNTVATHEEALSWKKIIEDKEGKANTDPLTGLLNRRAFSDRLNLDVTRSQRLGDHLTVAIIDLDHLKSINDKKDQGHPAGDAVLIGMGKFLNENFRKGFDYAGRWGGDELIIAFPDAKIGDMAIKLDELRQEFAKTFEHLGGTVSIGIAEINADSPKGQTMSQLIKSADEALYVAKNNGRNRVSFIDNGEIVDFDQAKAKTALPE